MFSRALVKKRGMELLNGNKLFFFVMIVLSVVLSFVPVIGVFAAFIILYFVVRRSLSVCAGKESKWFAFDAESFVTLFIQNLIVLGITVASMLALSIVSMLLAFVPFVGIILIMVLTIAYVIVITVISLALFFSQYIAVEYPKVGAWNSLVFSYKITKNNLLSLFVYSLSFILWYLLVFITFGIAAFFVNGYVSLSTTCLYNEFKSKSPEFTQVISKYGYTI